MFSFDGRRSTWPLKTHFWSYLKNSSANYEISSNRITDDDDDILDLQSQTPGSLVFLSYITCFDSWVIGMQDMQLEDLSVEFSGNIFLNHKSYQ